MTKILILTLDAGFGHRRAATAIADVFQKRYQGEVECHVVNPIQETGKPGIICQTVRGYDNAVRHYPALHSLIYHASDQHPMDILSDQAIAKLLFPVLEQLIAAAKPDGIISTFPIYNTSTRKALDALSLNIPLYTVVTDLGDVHRFWFHPGPDIFFVASEELKLQAVQGGIDAAKVIVSGVPIDTRFAEEPRGKEIIREQLGWNPNLPTLLAIGSQRVNRLLTKLRGIEECSRQLQLCVVAGGDDKLYQDAKTKQWNIPAFIYNYVENIPDLMHAADGLITKAGGLITSEALACGLPMAIIDAISGQETGNVHFIEKNQVGVVAQTAEDLREIVSRWLANDQAALKQNALNARRIGKPDAAYQVAQCVARGNKGQRL